MQILAYLVEIAIFYMSVFAVQYQKTRFASRLRRLLGDEVFGQVVV